MQRDARLFCLEPCLFAGDVDFADEPGRRFAVWNKRGIKTKRKDIGGPVSVEELSVEAVEVAVVGKNQVDFSFGRLFPE